MLQASEHRAKRKQRHKLRSLFPSSTCKPVCDEAGSRWAEKAALIIPDFGIFNLGWDNEKLVPLFLSTTRQVAFLAAHRHGAGTRTKGQG